MKSILKKSVVAATLFAVVLSTSSCGSKIGLPEKNDEGKIQFSVSNWPDDTNPKGLENANNNKKKFEEKYPELSVVPDTYAYDTKTFNMKAKAGTTTVLFDTYYTEAKKIISAGYAKDITEMMEKYNMKDTMNKELLELVSDEDGRIYGIPTSAYIQGLFIDKKLFKQAGLVNEDGSIKYPKTYDEVAEYAKTIKEKTGVAGLALCTANGQGGWHFMNIAWSYGVNFMEQDKDGKWKATFDSEEMINAVKYVYDLKWKYNVLPDTTVIDQAELQKLFGTYQAGMIILNPPGTSLSQKLGMAKEDIMAVSMPAGPKGRYTQIGGGIRMFSPYATDAQIEAAFKWTNFNAKGYELTDEYLANLDKSQKLVVEQNGIVLGRDVYDIWTSKERVQKVREVSEKNRNIDPKDFADFFNFDNVTVRAEEPVCCQELYTIIDGVMQEVITNENVDIPALVKKANEDMQHNHLDNYEE